MLSAADVRTPTRCPTPLTELGVALEKRGYDVAGTSVIRSRHRVELLGQQPAAELRRITSDTLGDGLVGLDVPTESVDGADGVRTVVSFRYRG